MQHDIYYSFLDVCNMEGQVYEGGSKMCGGVGMTMCVGEGIVCTKMVVPNTFNYIFKHCYDS